MSWEFKLRPDSGVFSDEVMASMEAFLLERPGFRRPDGLIVVRATKEARDRAMSPEWIKDPPPPGSVWFVIKPDAVVCGVYGPSDVNIITADFVRYCQANWACTLYAEGGEPVPINEFETWSESYY